MCQVVFLDRLNDFACVRPFAVVGCDGLCFGSRRQRGVRSFHVHGNCSGGSDGSTRGIAGRYQRGERKEKEKEKENCSHFVHCHHIPDKKLFFGIMATVEGSTQQHFMWEVVVP